MTGESDRLSRGEYVELLHDARSLGCESVQFIGGEPTLNSSIGDLIKVAHQLGFSFIEVFSNLLRLPDSLVSSMKDCKVHVATSVYAPSPDVHERITGRKGSFAKTINNVQRLMALGLPVRAGFIEMDDNRGLYPATKSFLNERGVVNVGYDRIRSFGRGNNMTSDADMKELCGHCSDNILSVGADGTVSPCVMSRQWSIGRLQDNSLQQLAHSNLLSRTRELIAEATSSNIKMCYPDPCQPDRSCYPNCTPSTNCHPSSGEPCAPNRWCDPIKR